MNYRRSLAGKRSCALKALSRTPPKLWETALETRRECACPVWGCLLNQPENPQDSESLATETLNFFQPWIGVGLFSGLNAMLNS